jgi:predicted ATPase
MPNTVERLRIENFGPIVEAEVEFGDLTVFVGPQATGKSLFLQIFKLLQDRGLYGSDSKAQVWSGQVSHRSFWSCIWAKVWVGLLS